ncbi:acyl-CoA N-acyltransferase [Cyathus striatus]|nr:acyl-CoA N-acyltransferase [Cyathus striatus]
MYCMANGPGAPREAGIKAKLSQWPAYAAYSMFTVGLALAIRPSLPHMICVVVQRTLDLLLPPPIQTFLGIPQAFGFLNALFTPLITYPRLPLLISAISASSVILLIAYVNHAFVGYCRNALATDLHDVDEYYRSPEVAKKGGQFWVVEDVDKSDVVGCVGLDTSGTTPQLRRMCVHPSYRRMGLAQRLIDALLSHTIKHNILCHDSKQKLKIKEIAVGTLTCQEEAIRLYSRRGWEVVSREKEDEGPFWKPYWEVKMRRLMDVGPV